MIQRKLSKWKRYYVVHLECSSIIHSHWDFNITGEGMQIWPILSANGNCAVGFFNVSRLLWHLASGHLHGLMSLTFALTFSSETVITCFNESKQSNWGFVHQNFRMHCKHTYRFHLTAVMKVTYPKVCLIDFLVM